MEIITGVKIQTNNYICKECGREVILKSKQKIRDTYFLNICRICRQKIKDKNKNLKRNCPNCNNVISYNYTSDYYDAIRKNTLCKSCMINIGKFKKGHISHKQSLFQCWYNKYGESIAKEKLLNFKMKQSLLNTGIKNSMYNKPTPVGSGNGWSGWYKNYYFRSLLELSFIVKILERFKFNWISAECKELTIKYTDYNGTPRTYRADFLVNNKYLIECKPKKLQNTITNTLKSNAATLFCKENGYKYKFIDIPILSQEQLLYLYNTKQIKFLEKYETKFKQFNGIP